MTLLSSRAQRALAGASVGLALALSASSASADPQSDAKDLFQQGRELREKNDCGSAAPLFRKAWTIYPAGLGSLRNLAECEETLGHFASARRAWLDLKRALITAPPDQKYEGWDNDAEQAAARLKPKVASFVVDVVVSSPSGEAPATEKTGVELAINGESVASTLVGTPLERDPGTYVIRAALKDAQPVEQSVALGAGDNPRVTLRLTVVPPQVAPPPPPPPPPEDHSTRRTIGWAVAGVGAAALVGSGITFLLYRSDKSTIEDNCPDPSRCTDTPENRDASSRGPTMGTLTSILFPLGVVGVGAGLALVFTSGSSASAGAAAKPSGVRTLRLTPGLGGVQLGGTF